MSFQILGTGSFAPEKVLTNGDLSNMVETSDEWITKRVGVKERHVCTTESNTDMGVAAALAALENAGVRPQELDLIIGATISADTISPGLAGMVQNRIGAACPCFDMNVACPGFLFALDVAAGFFARKVVKKVLVVSSERMSGLIDWADRGTCVIFGDGAGAAVLGEGDNYLSSTLSTICGDNVLSLIHICPVRNSCSSRKAAAWAASSGVPICSKGVSSRRASRSAGERSPFMGVSITPGARQLTRTPEGPSSLARAFVRPMTPAFAAE